MSAFLLVCLGAAAVGLALVDVFYTVLFPASGHGPLREPVAKGLRRLFGLTRALKSQDRRRRLLSYAGPVQITVTLAVWFALLLVGWAAVYLPALGASVAASQGATQQGWGTALYVSGYALTTLGTGDVVPTTGAYRMVTVAEAATGFATISLVISYFNSVYTTLVGRNAFALSVHHRSRGTGRGDRVVAALWSEGEAAAAVHLAEMAAGLRTIAQTHRSYPVLRSFHYRRDYEALPRMLLTCLETSTLLRTTLDPDRSSTSGSVSGSVSGWVSGSVSGRTPLHGTAVLEIEDAARAVCTQLVSGARHVRVCEQQQEDWAQHHREMVVALAREGVPVRTDQASTDAYVEVRGSWEGELAALADALLYDWRTASP